MVKFLLNSLYTKVDLALLGKEWLKGSQKL